MKWMYGVNVEKERFFETWIESETDTHYKIRSLKKPIPKNIVDDNTYNKSYYGTHYFSTEQKAIGYLKYVESRNENENKN